MTKTDFTKHQICIAAIKRHTMKPYDFQWTKFFESNTDFPYTGLPLELNEHERIICSTVIDADNFSILTTQKLISKQQGEEHSGSIEGATDKGYGDFKGYRDKLYTLGTIQLQNGSAMQYSIETGRASMVMIYGIRTLLRIQQMSAAQIDTQVRIWHKNNEAP